jgi:hypothetical protein
MAVRPYVPALSESRAATPRNLSRWISSRPLSAFGSDPSSASNWRSSRSHLTTCRPPVPVDRQRVWCVSRIPARLVAHHSCTTAGMHLPPQMRMSGLVRSPRRLDGVESRGMPTAGQIGGGSQSGQLLDVRIFPKPTYDPPLSPQ